MEILWTVAQARLWREQTGGAAGLVPTMGALHEAHASLMRRARSENSSFAVSVFVNPAQFAPGEDIDSYPRTFEEDCALCEREGAAAVFCPGAGDIYPEGFSTTVSVGSLTRTMCGASRPGHFDGVAAVVAKLFNIMRPSRAYFGQKDYQQYRVIQQITADLNLGADLVMCPTVREEDGLALSSRNSYLDAEQRRQAAGLFRALKTGERLIRMGEEDAAAVTEAVKEVIRIHIPSGKIDYAGVYDCVSLEEAEAVRGEVVIAAAVFLGKARLIDNILINE